MILLPFFDILTGFRFRKNTHKSDFHSLRRPWLDLTIHLNEIRNKWKITERPGTILVDPKGSNVKSKASDAAIIRAMESANNR